MESHPSEAGNESPAITNGEDADFDISVMEESEVKKVCNQNKYVKELADGCYLSLLQETKTKNAFKKDKEKGLFHLIFTPSFFDSCLKQMNDKLSRKGKSKISKEKFMAYVGLETAMSLVPLNSISQYWESKMFSGHQDFKDVMSRNDFQEICGATKFHPPEYDNENQKRKDGRRTKTLQYHICDILDLDVTGEGMASTNFRCFPMWMWVSPWVLQLASLPWS